MYGWMRTIVVWNHNQQNAGTQLTKLIPLQIVPQHITRTTAEAQESHSTAEHHPGHVRLNLRMISAPGGMLWSCINHGTSHVDPT